jgi:very-short-patch-repair endonuclease
MALEDDILALLAREPGLKGREIAARLGCDRRLANSTLTSLGRRHRVRQDAGYRWFPVVPNTQPIHADLGNGPQPRVDTTLARLCRYYLQCLSLDENGVRLFARDRFGPRYVELPVLPQLDPEVRPVGSFQGVAELFRRLRHGASRKVPYLGYPVRLRHHRTQNWEGYFVEPVFLYEFGDDALQPGTESDVSDELPTLNSRVLKSLAMGDESQVMDEAATLAEELGFSEPDFPELEDYVQRLVEIRPNWDWKEEISPENLSSGIPLADIDEVGIFNRAIVFGCERPLYTRGLEQELVKLQAMPEESYAATSLGSWLRRDFTSLRVPENRDSELLEPLPLNSEQRESVEKALVRPLTVVTGPPGTGKSQVVSTLLINAAKLGLRVLFASKNNKAVDVVEARVNALGPRPILLRLGGGHYQENLLQYLTTLLASRSTAEDAEDYREAEQAYLSVTTKIRNLKQRAEKVVRLRNEVDGAEREAEHLRNDLGEDCFARFGSLDSEDLVRQAKLLGVASGRASRDKQSFLLRLFWFAVRDSRLTTLRGSAGAARSALEAVGILVPPAPTVETDVPAWVDVAERLHRRSEYVRVVSAYFKLLQQLTGGDHLENLTSELAQLKEDCAIKSMRVWDAWLRLAPSRLNSEERNALGEFGAVLRLIAQGNEQGHRAGRQVFARYYRLFPRLVSQLPCWAVTSLSARGRVPLEAGFFDLLVVDEASQCDIASLLPLLFRTRAAVIIGDPMQLRHISAIPRRRDRDLLQQNGLADTHLNWAFSENSAFDLASPLASADDIVMLRDHHRSHSDIIGFSDQHFYEGRLRVATNYDRLRRLPLNGPAVRWINVQGHVTRPGSSALNEAEAQAVVKELVRIVLEQGYQGSIGVVTPFRAQVSRIRDIIHTHPQANLLLTSGELLVDTVYRFQGDERDLILFSPVVSHGISRGAVHWLRKTANQFNVAITRARAALVIVGDLSAAEDSDIQHLSAFAAYVSHLDANAHPHGGSSAEGYDGGPQYPTVSHPERVSDWEQVLYVKLYQSGLRPIPQYDVEKFTLDFALLVNERRLDIEVDGERYHRDWTGELLRRDQLRNMRLIELGWDVMRFWVYELRDNMPQCIERVRTWVNS